MLGQTPVRVGLDSNVLDRTGPAPSRSDAVRANQVRRFRALVEAGAVEVVLAPGVRQELHHPHAPVALRDATGLAPEAIEPEPLDVPFRLKKAPTPAQHIARIRIRAIVQGNARAGKHTADAAHLSDAFESGCIFFVTHDGRLLRKGADIEATLPGLRVVTLDDFLALVDADGADDAPE